VLWTELRVLIVERSIFGDFGAHRTTGSRFVLSLAATSAYAGAYRDSSGRSYSRKSTVQPLPGAFFVLSEVRRRTRLTTPRAKLDKVT
jgi:hypothetical protein